MAPAHTLEGRLLLWWCRLHLSFVPLVRETSGWSAWEDSAPAHVLEEYMLLWWGKLHPFLFPFVPQTFDGYAKGIFWHSMLFTLPTPLFRIVKGLWRGGSLLYYFVSLMMPMWLVEHCLEMGFIHPGIDYDEKLVRAAEAPLPGATSVKGASCFNLYMDIVQHKPLPRIMLVLSSMASVTYMIKAIRVVKQKPHGWKLAHQDLMVLCFLVSIQGAGPIRMISEVQTWLGCGPVKCQNENGGLATMCMWPYVFRMFCVSFWTLYTRGIYCKMRGDRDLTLALLRDLLSTCVALIAALALSSTPWGDMLLDVVLGLERTSRGSFTVFLAGALQLGGGLIL